jgi:hypothetical protein
MIKRLLLIGALCIGLTGLVLPGANAGIFSSCRIQDGTLSCHSIEAETIYVGISDPSLAQACVSLYIGSAEVFCKNQPGNADPANGKVFFPHVSLGKTSQVQLLSKRGKSYSDIIWENSELYDDLVGSAPASQFCPNDNWYLVEDQIIVLELDVYYQGWVLQDSAWVQADALCQHCTWAPDENGCHYNCKAQADSICDGLGLTDVCSTVLNGPAG